MRQVIVPSVGRIVLLHVSSTLTLPAIVLAIDERLDPEKMNFVESSDPRTLLHLHVFGVNCSVNRTMAHYGETHGGVDGDAPVWSWPPIAPAVLGPSMAQEETKPRTLADEIADEKYQMGTYLRPSRPSR